MIEKMNLTHIVALEQNKDQMVSALRDLGVLHISEKCSADEKINARIQKENTERQEIKNGSK